MFQLPQTVLNDLFTTYSMKVHSQIFGKESMDGQLM